MTTTVTSDWLFSGVMTILLWLKLSWRDHRLAWEPARYEGVNLLRSDGNVLCYLYTLVLKYNDINQIVMILTSLIYNIYYQSAPRHSVEA